MVGIFVVFIVILYSLKTCTVNRVKYKWFTGGVPVVEVSQTVILVEH